MTTPQMASQETNKELTYDDLFNTSNSETLPDLAKYTINENISPISLQ